MPEVTVTMLGRLRCGQFKDADEITQQLWIVICTEVIPKVSSAYRSVEARQEYLMSEVVPAALEALVLMLLQICYSQWVKEWNKEVPRLTTKSKGPNFAS